MTARDRKCCGCGKPIDKRDMMVGVNDSNRHPSVYSFALLAPGGLYQHEYHYDCHRKLVTPDTSP